MKRRITGGAVDMPAGRPVPQGSEAALFPSEVAYLTGLSARTLDTVRVTGGGIPYLKFGRSVRYRRGDVDTWIAARVRKSTTDQGPK